MMVVGSFALWSVSPAWTALNNTQINSTLFAAVTLPDDLKPTYAPDVKIVEGGNEASYVNYFLQLLAGSLLYLAAPVAVLIIAVSGLRYVISHGDDGQIENAKKTLMFAVIGLVAIMLSFAIVQAVIRILTGIGAT